MAQAYITGPIIAQLKGAPFHDGITVKTSDVVESLTARTRGPIKEQPQPA